MNIYYFGFRKKKMFEERKTSFPFKGCKLGIEKEKESNCQGAKEKQRKYRNRAINKFGEFNLTNIC